MRSVVTGSLISLALAGTVLAQEPKPFPDFTFKRVGLPEPGARKRITVQIDPAATPPAPIADPEPQKDQPQAGAYDWYWQNLSPDLGDAGPGRLKTALGGLSRAPKDQAAIFPRLQMLRNIARDHGIEILKATIGTRVSPALVLAVISVESAGRRDALSPAGAAGLMQLMPATAKRFGVPDRGQPADNIKGGVAYLDTLMRLYDSDPAMVLAAYNAGENAVKTYGGVPPFAETRAYVPKVLAAWTVARGLCLTPPELLSDGCVFAGLGVRSDG